MARSEILFVMLVVAACGRDGESKPANPVASAVDAVDAPVDKAAIAAAKAILIAKHGEAHRAAIERGVDQVAALWRTSDGDLAAFCVEQFVAEPKQKDVLFERMQALQEQIAGHFNELARSAAWASHVEDGPMLPVDGLLAAYDPGAHATEDMFETKVAFAALLNFPLTTLADRATNGESYSRRTWAEVRLAGRYDTRVPSGLVVAANAAGTAADRYIGDYTLWMHHVLGEDGKRRWPSKKRLLIWAYLHEEIKASYSDPEGVLEQRTIAKVLERIATQTIPNAVIDNPRLDWNPFTNQVTVAEPGTVEDDAPADGLTTASDAREPDTRFAHLRAQFLADKAIDAVSPFAPTRMERAFKDAEIPETQVRKMLVELLDSPLAAVTAKEIEQRLGRKLEPHDAWYAFAADETTQPQLDALTRKRYPTTAAFAKDVPRILRGLGFSAERAKYIADRIAVDPSRAEAHAWKAFRRGDKEHLRIRVDTDGMSYKEYGNAIQQLGFNVEETFSLYDIDFPLLEGEPSLAFAVAVASLFRARAVESLGQLKPAGEAERLRVLDAFWTTRAHAGVALVELDVWHWLYDHPTATATELREATNQIARDAWNRYYAPVLGGKDSVLLCSYSMTIAAPLRVFTFVVSSFIAAQLEELVGNKDKSTFAKEVERISRLGRILPDLWMKQATGTSVSAQPFLAATARALKK